MLRPSNAIDARMKFWDVGGRQSHTFASQETSRCSATTGQRDSAF